MCVSDWSSDLVSSYLGNSAGLNGWAVSSDIASAISTAFMARHYAGCLQIHKMRDGRVGGEPEATWMPIHRRGPINAVRATVTAMDREGVTVTTWSGMEQRLRPAIRC